MGYEKVQEKNIGTHEGPKVLKKRKKDEHMKAYIYIR
jgi:hypothetical protein